MLDRVRIQYQCEQDCVNCAGCVFPLYALVGEEELDVSCLKIPDAFLLISMA
jgi:hypothetical protein